MTSFGGQDLPGSLGKDSSGSIAGGESPRHLHLLIIPPRLQQAVHRSHQPPPSAPRPRIEDCRKPRTRSRRPKIGSIIPLRLADIDRPLSVLNSRAILRFAVRPSGIRPRGTAAQGRRIKIAI